jgi:hypothetical protein
MGPKFVTMVGPNHLTKRIGLAGVVLAEQHRHRAEPEVLIRY